MLKRKKVSSKKSKDVSWILDGIVGFLQSATWTIPIMNFVDDNCGCFESKEENKFEYTDIHEKYKSLVERLLYKYMQELEISEELFSRACEQHKASIQPVEGIFEYIWAADDFLLFKTIMTKHNMELDIQAMTLMKIQNYSGLDENFLMNSEPTTEEVDFILKKSKKEFVKASSLLKKLEEQEEENFQRAIEFSKQESERLKKLIELENEMLEKAIRLSLQSVNDVNNSNNVPQTPLSSAGSSLRSNLNSSEQNQSSSTFVASKSTNKLKNKKEVNKKILNPLKERKDVDITNDWIVDVNTASCLPLDDNQPTCNQIEVSWFCGFNQMFEMTFLLMLPWYLRRYYQDVGPYHPLMIVPQWS